MGSSVCQRLLNNVSVCSKLQKKIGMKHVGKGQNYLCKGLLDSVVDYMIFFLMNNNYYMIMFDSRFRLNKRP